MQIGEMGSAERKRADEIFDLVIGPVVEDAGLAPYRADKDLTPGPITPQFISELYNARVVIADLTGGNPNVFYELGLAQSSGLPVICIADKARDLPFDAKDERVIELGDYESGGLSAAQGAQAKKNLQESLKIVLSPGYRPSSLVRRIAGPTTKANDSPKQTKYDVFISSPMFAFRDEQQYQHHRANVLRFIRSLDRECGFSCYYAGKDRPNYDDFEMSDVALSNDLQALRDSSFFVLLIPVTSATSALVETGAALILGKPSIYFIHTDAQLPFALEHAGNSGDAKLPRIKIYPYTGIENLIHKVEVNKKGLFNC